MNVYVVLMGFNNPTVIRNAIDRFESGTDQTGLPIRTKILVDGKYPLPDPVKNRQDFKDIAAEKNWQLINLKKNEGQNQNFNLIVNGLDALYAPKREDVLAFWEPDAMVNDPKWLRACCEVMADKSFHNIGFVTPHRHPSWILTNNGRELNIAGHRCRHLTWPGGWPMGIYSWGFVEDMKSMHVSHEFYGGTEGNILHHLNSTDHSGLMFCDIEDLSNINDFDASYIAWKAETIRLPKGSQVDFEDWLKQRGLL